MLRLTDISAKAPFMYTLGNRNCMERELQSCICPDDSDLFGSDSDSDMDGDSDAIDEVALRHTRDVAGIRGQTDDSDVEGDHGKR